MSRAGAGDVGEAHDDASRARRFDAPGTRVRRGARLALLAIIALVLGVLSLGWSSVAIPPPDVVAALVGPADAVDASVRTIVRDIRLPRTLTAALVGAALGIAGLLMQTVFRNALASPFTLGVSSGASLGVALVVLTAPLPDYADAPSFVMLVDQLGHLGTVVGAALGAFGVLAVMLTLAARVRDVTIVLLLGVVMSSLVGALVTVLVFFADARRTRAFVEWGLGSFTQVHWGTLPTFALAVLVGVVGAGALVKPLNALLLGEAHAESLGVRVRASRLGALAAASVLAGAVVAFAGPIGFLGIAVPHLARGLLRTADHRLLVPGSVAVGAVLALACGLLAELPGSSLNLPVNAAAALFGAPVAIVVLLRMRHAS
ncbi:MAG: iron ABC transporter permease [Acidobacteriota bacterium]